MKHYQFRFPPGLILPGLLGLLVLIVVVSVGMVLFGIILAALVVAGITSAIYRSLFGARQQPSQPRPRTNIRINRASGIDDIPYSDYKEIGPESEDDNSNEETK